MNLDLQNKCLLDKWLFKLSNEHDIWQDLSRNKYIKDNTFSQVQRKAADSHLGESHECKRNFLKFGDFQVKGW